MYLSLLYKDLNCSNGGMTMLTCMKFEISEETDIYLSIDNVCVDKFVFYTQWGWPFDFLKSLSISYETVF